MAVQRLVLDVDALVHARGRGLLAEIESLIRDLPDRAYMERSVYHRDAARSGLGPLLGRWREGGVLRDLIDYRDLRDGERRFRELLERGRRRRLSRQDVASLLLAITLGEAGLLTGERALAAAAREHRVVAIDLFDVVRVGLRAGRLTTAQAREMCAEWDRDRFSAGRPVDYSGNFAQELALREARNPLPF